MNDLIRPALYGAYHEILPVTHMGSAMKHEVTDIVGRSVRPATSSRAIVNCLVDEGITSQF